MFIMHITLFEGCLLILFYSLFLLCNVCYQLCYTSVKFIVCIIKIMLIIFTVFIILQCSIIFYKSYILNDIKLMQFYYLYYVYYCNILMSIVIIIFKMFINNIMINTFRVYIELNKLIILLCLL